MIESNRMSGAAALLVAAALALSSVRTAAAAAAAAEAEAADADAMLRRRGLGVTLEEALKNLEQGPGNNNQDQLEASPRIVGGTPVALGDYPSYGFNAGPTGLCGGTLVAPDIVLTAAHCEGLFLDGWNQGGIDISGASSVEFAVDEEFPHPDYTEGTEHNDIMLVKLSDLSDAPLQQLNFDPNFPSVVRSVERG